MRLAQLSHSGGLQPLSIRKTLQIAGVLLFLSVVYYYIGVDSNLESKILQIEGSEVKHANKTSFDPAHHDSFDQYLLQHFPACRAPEQLTAQSKHAINIWQWLQPEYISTTTPAKYDHLSCFVMKARYNCAVPPLTSFGRTPLGTASQYKLVLKRKVANNSSSSTEEMTCDPRELIEAVGGPTGSAKFGVGLGNQGFRNNAPIQVLLQGNSYLRAVWEALVCGFQDQITNIQLLSHGPQMNLATVANRNGTLLNESDLGDFFDASLSDLQKEGCHGPGRSAMYQYYWPNVTVPASIPGCTDDMAVVEFGHRIRFVFLFHPTRFDKNALMKAYRKLGIVSDDTFDKDIVGSSSKYPVQVLAWTGEEHETKGLQPAREIDLNGLLPRLVQAQNESIHYFFGANNPWITHPPDNVRAYG